MSRFLFSVLFVFIACHYSISQSIDNDVVATAGTHFENSCGIKLSWTMGESVTSTISDGSWMITQGFHQDWEEVTSIENHIEQTIQINVYPNPMDNELLVTVKNTTKELMLSLYDIAGRKVDCSTMQPNQLSTSFSVSWLSAGSYVLYIEDKDGVFNKTYRLEKFK